MVTLALGGSRIFFFRMVLWESYDFLRRMRKCFCEGIMGGSAVLKKKNGRGFLEGHHFDENYWDGILGRLPF